MPKVVRTRATVQTIRHLKYHERLTNTSIAEKLGCGEHTVARALRMGPVKIKEPKRRRSA